MSEASLPTGWRTGSVGELADFVRGVTYKRAQGSSKPSDGHVPLLRATNIVEGKIVEEDLVYVPSSVVSPSQVLKDGDLLLATSSGSLTVVGKSAPVRGLTNTCFGAFCGVLRPRRETNQQFLQRYIQSQSVRDSWSSAARGTNINNLKPTTILQTPMPIPPPEEQDRIVEILEEQLSRLDAAVKSVQTVREKAAQFRRSLLHAAFTGKRFIDLESQPSETRFKDFELGELLVDIQSGFASGKHNASGIGVVHIRPMNISRRGVLDFSEKKFVENVGGHRLRRGDVLFNNTNSPALVGKTALVDVDTELAFSNHMTRLRVNESRILSNYLALRLHALWEDGYFESICSNHVNQASVSSKRLTKVTIGVPELSVQYAVVERLQVLLSNLDATLAVADEVERKANALRRSLLHAAFTGELTRSWREAHV